MGTCLPVCFRIACGCVLCCGGHAESYDRDLVTTMPKKGEVASRVRSPSERFVVGWRRGVSRAGTISVNIGGQSGASKSCSVLFSPRPQARLGWFGAQRKRSVEVSLPWLLPRPPLPQPLPSTLPCISPRSVPGSVLGAERQWGTGVALLSRLIRDLLSLVHILRVDGTGVTPFADDNAKSESPVHAGQTSVCGP